MFSTHVLFCLLFTPFVLFPPFLCVSFVNWSCPFQPVFLFKPLSVCLLCHACCSRVRCLPCASCSKVCSVFFFGYFLYFHFSDVVPTCVVYFVAFWDNFLSLGLVFGIYCTLDFSMLFVQLPTSLCVSQIVKKGNVFTHFLPLTEKILLSTAIFKDLSASAVKLNELSCGQTLLLWSKRSLTKVHSFNLCVHIQKLRVKGSI